MALQYLLAPTFQFVNTAGKPLSGGAYMEVYVHGTRTKYFCASDFNGTLHPFRIPLDSLGSNIVLANDTGSYDVYAYNRYGTLMMSRYNVKPGAGGGIGGTITSTDGSIDIHPTEDGVDLSVNGLDPSCLKVSADPRTTDGKFHFDSLIREGDQAYVDNEGAIRLLKGWYHFTANVQLAWNAGARNETHQVTLYTTLSNSVIDFDISHVHTETIELSGDVSIAQDGSELVIGVSGMPTGLEASVISMDVHAITGKDGHDKYYAGNGITISNENYIAADFDEVQEKLVAGDGVTIEGNVISAPTLVQAQADWTEEDTESRAYIKHKPDLDVFATKTEVNTGLAGKQNTIPDLAAIRSGAQAGASAVQPADLANVATTGDYNDLNNKPNLTVYATKTEVNTGLATKQNVISDLATIRSGAAAGATAVQPADLATVATTGDYDDLTNKPDLSVYATTQAMNTALAGKQDTINDLSTIRSGAAAGSTALQPSDVATVATTGDYDDLIDKPDLSVYATGAELTAGLATKQDTISDLATIRSGAAEGATAVQPGDLATVATTGSYGDLVDKPTIPAAQVNSDWNSNSGVSQILNKPTLATVATTGDYDDLSNKPSIPAAQVNSDWNAVSGVSEILNKPTIPTATSDLTNDSGFITLSDVPAQAQADWTESDTSDPSYIQHKPNLATVATTGAYSDLTGTPTINNVPTVTSSDNDKVLKASYVGGVGSYSWQTEQGGGSTYTAGDAIDIDQNNEISVAYDSNTLDVVQPTPSTWSVSAINSSDEMDLPSDAASLMYQESDGVVLRIPANTLVCLSGQTLSDVVLYVEDVYGLTSFYDATHVQYEADPNNPAYAWLSEQTITVNGGMSEGNPDWFGSTSEQPIKFYFADTSDPGNRFGTSNPGVVTTLSSPVVFNSAAVVASGLTVKNPLPASAIGDASKVLTVDNTGAPVWAAAASATVDQTYNATSTNAQSGTAVAQAVATKEDAFDVGTGLEMDTSGATPTLQVEAPVDIVAGPGIVIDNPDGNTLRVSVDQAFETTVLYDANGSPNQTGPWTLSEVRTNFEWIDIVFGIDASGNEVTVQRFKAGSPYMKVDINRYDDDPNWKISTMTLKFNQATMSIKSNSIARYIITTSGAISVSTAAAQAPFIYQVIGIHRTASN